MGPKYVRIQVGMSTRTVKFRHDGTLLCRAPARLIRTTVKVLDNYTVISEGYAGKNKRASTKQILENAIESTIQKSHPNLKQMLECSRWIDDGYTMATIQCSISDNKNS